MKKILSIVSGNPSGSLNIAIDISNYLKTQGYEVIDIFRKYNNTDLKGIIVIKDRCTLDYIISLGKFIRNTKPDLIIVHGYSTHIWTKLALAYSKLNIKLIHVEHNTEKYTPFRRYLTQKLDKYTNKYICVSKGVANHLIKQGIDKSKVQVIYNGIDIKKFDLPKEPHNIFTVGMVARFSKQKDQMTLIKAIEYLVKEKKEKINLLLMGVGKTRKKCEKYIIENNLNEHIKIIEGNFKDLIVKTDLFVLATHYEGLPLVLCEAMASHTPIIATNVPGVNEIIINNKTGLLVKENDVYDLANNILKMKKDLVLRKNFVHQSDIFINKNFNLQLMYNNYINKIKEMIYNE
ncbi:Glycogen synthase [Megamonas hypermegale]|uniref:Glycogen synthase n=1 Tax=Megamonas hypermegale TaxID=158847 RepID=A0A239T7J6_9FIRM|nr:glycosyltransferase [Megamonas hypermegale]SNU93701.1 Glycogen synthase [Megamonas hypermegale]